MPLVRIDLIRGRSPEAVRAIADAVRQSLVDALKIPERDRFHIVTQHDADEITALDAGPVFQRTGDGTAIVHIFTQRGLSADDKQGL
ncbi:tautomerase family protein [Streptomyces sp. ISL-12]|uniref:tautomerase family protein n=1 Tax=Streptomyces sp. ISL-12 TaxID=2819177 RepID=UPI0020356831|nr:tautomerase family protein [Streptomyces sp. ISL-12]